MGSFLQTFKKGLKETQRHVHCGVAPEEEKGSTWKGQDTSLGSFVEQNLNLARVLGKLWKGALLLG